MSPKNWQNVKEVFHEALRHEGAARDEYLDKACSGDIEFRVEVESLLISLAEAQTFLEQPVVGELTQQPARQFENGRQISHYKIVSPLGVGGMGEVYLAHDLKLNRQVALKVLSSNMTADRDRLRRFQREAEVVSALNHPNILTIFEFDTDGDLQLFAGEYVKGETLREKIKRGPIPVDETLDIAVQTVSALQAAHEARVIHRDIKPENIMIRNDGYVKILDFGLAKLSHPPVEDENAKTRSQVFSRPGIIMGTTAYMSPEQARGKVIDARTDLFSFGVVLHEMLTGKALFSGDTATDVIAAIIQTEPPPVSEAANGVPSGFDPILANALEKDRNDRYQTAGELLTDLKDLKRRIDSGEQFETKAPDPGEIPTEIFSAPPTKENNVRTAKSPGYTALIAAIIALLVLAGLGLAYWFYGRSAAGAPEINSIAVLPFVNESGNADAEYLSDGMTEALISKLTQLPNLNVKARSTVFHYKGENADPEMVGRELAVQTVLIGRIVSRDDQVTLFLELVDAGTGNRIWGEQYSRRNSDLLALQNDIALDVSNKLKVKLSGAEEQRITRNYTENPEAYTLYLKGRYHVFKLTRPDVQTGIGYLQQAIAIDPNFTPAYVGLANAYRTFALSSDQRPSDVFPKARAMAQKAVELDGSLSEAHAALGFTIFWYDWDWAKSEEEYRKALQLNPDSADVHWAYGHLLSCIGRHDEGIAEIKLARNIEPLNLIINASEAVYLLNADRNSDAMEALKSTLEIDPEYWLAHLFLSIAYIDRGMYPEAAAEAERARQINPLSTQPLAYHCFALARAGRKGEAQVVLNELLSLSRGRYVPPYHIAIAYAGMNDPDKAIEWLEQAYRERDPKMVFLKYAPEWKELRSDTRYQRLITRMKFPE